MAAATSVAEPRVVCICSSARSARAWVRSSRLRMAVARAGGADDAGVDGVDADVLGGVAQRVHAVHAERRLRCVIGGVRLYPVHGAGRHDVDDRAAAGAFHGGRYVLAAQDAAVEVGLHGLFPMRLRQPVRIRLASVDAGAVDQDIDAAEVRFDGRHHPLHGIVVADV